MIQKILDSLGFRATRWYLPRVESNRHARVLSYFQEKSTILTYTSKEELLVLNDYASIVGKDDSIVEIGSYLGASTRYLVHGSRELRPPLVCIDTWNNETMPEGICDTFEDFKRNLEPHLSRVELVRSSSQGVRPERLPERIGLAFLDGDHSYYSTSSDLDLVKEKIVVGGFLIFHDIAAFASVARVVGSVMLSGDFQIAKFTGNIIVLRRGKFPIDG